MHKKPYYLPGDRRHKHDFSSFMRVDHAGELGAVVIYEGQLRYSHSDNEKKIITHMLEQEKEHLSYFETMLPKTRTRPSLFYGFWRKAGYAIGVLSRRASPYGGMALTVGVEETIDQHYADQLDYLERIEKTQEQELLYQKLKKFQDDEIQHKNDAIDYGAEKMPFYGFFKQLVHKGAKYSIHIASKI